MGTNNVTLIKSEKNIKVHRVVIGSVRSLGSQRFITAKIVNKENSKIEYITSEKTTSYEELNDACCRISKRISDNLK